MQDWKKLGAEAGRGGNRKERRKAGSQVKVRREK